MRLDATGLKAGREASCGSRWPTRPPARRSLDLEPFLGAAGHMLIVNAELTEASHAHPERQAARGPSVSFHPLMPAAGLYKLWVQFQRGPRRHRAVRRRRGGAVAGRSRRKDYRASVTSSALRRRFDVSRLPAAGRAACAASKSLGSAGS